MFVHYTIVAHFLDVYCYCDNLRRFSICRPKLLRGPLSTRINTTANSPVTGRCSTDRSRTTDLPWCSLHIPTTARRISRPPHITAPSRSFPRAVFPSILGNPATFIDVDPHGPVRLVVACALGGLEEDWLGAVYDKLHHPDNPWIQSRPNTHSHCTGHTPSNCAPRSSS
jgi:hypothetical protein